MIVTVTEEELGRRVVTVNVALVAPEGTVTEAGTVATEVLLLASVTTAPPAGAFPLSDTVPRELAPPVTLVGFRLMEIKASVIAGVTVRLVACVVPPKLAEIVTAVEVDTVALVTVNVALVLPTATVTDAGTVAADALLLASTTTAPPVGAAPFKVTVPCELLPPVTLVGFRLMEFKATVIAGVTVRLVVCVVPP